MNGRVHSRLDCRSLLTRVGFFLQVGILLVFISGPALAKVIYVDDDANAPGDGKSWVTAYRYLQDALQEGEPLPSVVDPGDPPTKKGAVRASRPSSISKVAVLSGSVQSVDAIEIRVAQGVYRPDRGIRQKAGDRMATFQLSNGLALKGGYAGIGALDPNARDRRLHETILSGDLTGNDVSVNDPCDLWREPSRSENAYHVVTASGTDGNTLLEGFTITAGNAYEYNYHPQAPNTHNSGGGLRNEGGSLWVRNCTFFRNVAEGRGGGGMCSRDGAVAHVVDCEFVENAAREGGGVFNGGSEAFFQNCLLRRNWSFSAGTGMCNDAAKIDCQRCSFTENDGGSASAVSHVSGSQGRFSECQFIGNSAKTLGAFVLGSRCDLTAIDCVFRGNEAGRNGGAVFVDTPFTMTLERCSFSQNKAISGGAIYVSESPYRVYEKGAIPLTIHNCLFSENSAMNGGAIYSRVSKLAVGNSTFWGNHAERGKAILADHYDEYRMPGYTEISNCILWDGANGIATLDSSPISIDYCNVSGGWKDVYDPRGVVAWGMGNLESDPLFADPNNGDYHLKSQGGRWEPVAQAWTTDDVTSPSVDSGDPAKPIGREPFPNGARINMGAYGGTPEASKSYFAKPACETIIAGDINGDCKVDFCDLAIMAMRWLEDRTSHRVVTTMYRLVEDKSSVASYCGRGGIKRYNIGGTLDLTIDYTDAKATFERVDVRSDKAMSFIDNLVGREEVFLDTNDVNTMFHLTQLVSTSVKDTEMQFVFAKNIPGFPFADVRLTVAFKEESVSIIGKFSDPMNDGCWHQLNAVAVSIGGP